MIAQQKTGKMQGFVFLAVFLLAMALVTAAAAEDAPSLPDLEVVSIAPNAGEIFANETNSITATVLNNGTADAGAFAVRFVVGTTEVNETVSSLAAGESADLTVVDEAVRVAGETVTVTVTADAGGAVVESDESDNVLTIEKTVVNNGYKGKRYTGGEDILSRAAMTLNGSLSYSVGDSAYKSGSGGWTTYTTNWAAADLPIPEAATVSVARLYLPYTWDKNAVMPDNVSLSFNGDVVPYAARYADRKQYGTSDYPYGMLVYNVTDLFDAAGNAAVLTKPADGAVSIRGMLLVVVYADAAESEKQIFFNEGFDMLYGGESKATTPGEATAYAPFAGVALPAGSARLISVAPGAGGPAEGDLLFNDRTWTDVWDYAGETQIGLDDRFVTKALNETPVVAFRSDEDYMEAAAAFLVVDHGTPDLEVVSVAPNTKDAPEVFANEPNAVTATVKNNGTSAAGGFVVRFDVGGETYEETVPLLPAGNTTTVTVTDSTIRTFGDEVPITATADADDVFAEADETDNSLTVTKTVAYNGYKGKRYTDGEDIVTRKVVNVTGGLLYSAGDSAYRSGSGGWTTYTANWTAGNLSLPDTATVEMARLYVPYTWDKNGVMPGNVSVAFNNATMPYEAHYADRKSFGSSDYPYGMLVYNVTDLFNVSGNAAVLTKPADGAVSIRGMLLFVVYADPSGNEAEILFNEGFDQLYGGEDRATTPEEATAYAPFTFTLPTGVTPDHVTLITAAPGAGPSEGDLLFNDQNWTDVWDYAGETQIGIDEREVAPYLNESPVAAFRSDGDWMEASMAVLVLDLGAPAVQDLEITAITPNANEIFANETNSIAATVMNNGTSASGAFQVQFSINGVVQNVSVADLAAGNETTVSVTDPAIRALGDAVTINVTTDASPENNLTLTKNVVYNGYKGKRYTGGEDIIELTNLTVTGGLLSSTGDSAYMSGSSGWTTYAANWTSADLAVPANATVDAAYLCAFYTYDKNQVMPDNASLSFNGVQVPYLAHYADRKLYGSYNYPSGMVVYNVTDTFDSSGNEAVFTNLGTGGSSFNGLVLFVVYDDPASTEKQILFNAGYDILSGKATYAVTPEEATAYAPFAYQPLLGVNLSTARLITVAPAASTEGTLLFGGQTWTPAWSYAGTSNIGIDDRNVTAYLNASPVAAFRSDNDYFDAACAVLVLEYGNPVVPPTPTPTPSSDGGSDDSSPVSASGNLHAGESASFSYAGPVSKVTVTAAKKIDGIMLAVVPRSDVPVDGPSSTVYRYIETDLTYVTDEAIQDAVFEFSVPLSWIREQGLTTADVVLMRYHNGAWTALPTELVREGGSTAYYRANSPGFSYFAIATEKNGASVGTPVPTETIMPTGTATPAVQETTAPSADVPAEDVTSAPSSAPTTTPASPLPVALTFAALGLLVLVKRK